MQSKEAFQQTQVQTPQIVTHTKYLSADAASNIQNAAVPKIAAVRRSSNNLINSGIKVFDINPVEITEESGHVKTSKH